MRGHRRNDRDTLVRLSTADPAAVTAPRRVIVRTCQRVLRWSMLTILLVLALYALAIAFHLDGRGTVAAALVSVLSHLAGPPLMLWSGAARWICHQPLPFMSRSCLYTAPLVAMAGYATCGWIIIYLLEFSIPRIIEHSS
jgi:hypothetical protein